MITSTALKYYMWVTSFGVLIFNVFVLIYRLKTQDRKSPNNILLLYLAASDMLMGAYILVIICINTVFEGKYVLEDENWRSSKGCYFLGFMSLLSVELSLFIQVYLSSIKLYVTGFLKGRAHIPLLKVNVIFSSIFVTVVCICITPVYLSSPVQSGFCLLLKLGNPNIVTDWVNLVFIILNAVTIVIYTAISIKQSILFLDSYKKVRQSGHVFGGISSSKFVIVMVVQVILNLICWIPIVIFYIVSLTPIRMSSHTVNWLLLTMLPMSSLVNPVLYTMRLIKIKKQ